MLPLSHQLATVDGVYNAIYVTGDAVGETMFFGEGAGAGPAASAVMGDVVEVARHVTLGVGPLVGCTCTDELPIVPMDDLKTKYYIRFKVADRSGVLAAMAGVFAKHNVSVYSVVQRGKKESGQVDLVYVTHTARWPRSPSSTTCCAMSPASSAWRSDPARTSTPLERPRLVRGRSFYTTPLAATWASSIIMPYQRAYWHIGDREGRSCNSQ